MNKIKLIYSAQLLILKNLKKKLIEVLSFIDQITKKKITEIVFVIDIKSFLIPLSNFKKHIILKLLPYYLMINIILNCYSGSIYIHKNLKRRITSVKIVFNKICYLYLLFYVFYSI